MPLFAGILGVCALHHLLEGWAHDLSRQGLECGDGFGLRGGRVAQHRRSQAAGKDADVRGNWHHSLDFDYILRSACARLGLIGGRTGGVVSVFSEDEWLIRAGFSVRGTVGGLHRVSRQSWWDWEKMSGGLYSGAKKGLDSARPSQRDMRNKTHEHRTCTL